MRMVFSSSAWCTAHGAAPLLTHKAKGLCYLLISQGAIYAHGAPPSTDWVQKEEEKTMRIHQRPFFVTDRFSRLRDNVQEPLLWGSFSTGFKRNKRKARGSIKEHFSVTDRVLRLLYLRRQLALLVVFVLKIDNGVVMTWTNVLLLCPFQSHLFPKTS